MGGEGGVRTNLLGKVSCARHAEFPLFFQRFAGAGKSPTLNPEKPASKIFSDLQEGNLLVKFTT
jgi:hypothetical protein